MSSLRERNLGSVEGTRRHARLAPSLFIALWVGAPLGAQCTGNSPDKVLNGAGVAGPLRMPLSDITASLANDYGQPGAAAGISMAVSSRQITVLELDPSFGAPGVHDSNTIALQSAGSSPALVAGVLAHEWTHVQNAWLAGTCEDPLTQTSTETIYCGDSTDEEMVEVVGDPCGACNHAELLAEGRNQLAELTHADSGLSEAEKASICDAIDATEDGIAELWDTCENAPTTKSAACEPDNDAYEDHRGCGDGDGSNANDWVNSDANPDNQEGLDEDPGTPSERPKEETTEETKDCCPEKPDEEDPDEGDGTGEEKKSDEIEASGDGSGSEEHPGDGEDEDDPCADGSGDR